MTDKPDSALKACPFCGGEAELEVVNSGAWSVGCEEKTSIHYCMGYQSLTSFATKAEAIAAWNTRSIPALASDEMVNAILSHLRQCKDASVYSGSDFNQGVTRGLEVAIAQIENGHATAPLAAIKEPHDD